MNDHTTAPSGPVQGAAVEIVDRISGVRVTARVETVGQESYSLRFDLRASVPDEACVRWFDGDTAWQAISRIERIDGSSVTWRLPPARDWEAVQVRASLRVPVDNSPLLVRIVSSEVLAKSRLVHAVCLDVSATGCRASWPLRAPRVGDCVDVAWEIGDWRADRAPAWVSARVARVSAMPFGARQVGFAFEVGDPEQASRVRAWHQAWLSEYRMRPMTTRADVSDEA